MDAFGINAGQQENRPPPHNTNCEPSTGESKFEVPATYPRVLVFNGRRYPFNPRCIRYTKPSPTQHGGFVVRCTYALTVTMPDGATTMTKEVPIVLQSPPMTSTFGISSKEHGKGADKKMKTTVDVTFREESGADVQAFHQVMLAWDRSLMEHAQQNMDSWFPGGKMTRQILSYLYNPMVRVNVSKKNNNVYPDSMRGNIRRSADSYLCQAFDVNRQPISVEEVTPRCTVQAQFRQTGVWFTDKMFVSSFETSQIQKLADGENQAFSMVGDDDAMFVNTPEAEMVDVPPVFSDAV